MKICASNTITRLSLGIAFVLGSAIGAEAATFTAFDITSSPVLNPPSTELTTGFQFNVSQDITVTSIGAYLRGGDNGGNLVLNAPRKVRIWTVDGTEIGSNPALNEFTITQGAPNTSIQGDFVYLDLNATGQTFSLTPGDYRIASFIDTNPGDIAFFNTGIDFAAGLSASPNTYQFGIGSGDGFPDQNTSNSFYTISANFIFDDDTNGGGNPTVPEPGLIGGLLLFGLGGLLQKRSQNH